MRQFAWRRRHQQSGLVHAKEKRPPDNPAAVLFAGLPGSGRAAQRPTSIRFGVAGGKNSTRPVTRSYIAP
ncbi:MAG TPA: hypothetical protein PKC18_02910, partial [Lacipirellulaceae bacterium]|nr:hypothetical protein [Lacipirellulaceae bacterium]